MTERQKRIFVVTATNIHNIHGLNYNGAYRNEEGECVSSGLLEHIHHKANKSSEPMGLTQDDPEPWIYMVSTRTTPPAGEWWQVFVDGTYFGTEENPSAGWQKFAKEHFPEKGLEDENWGVILMALREEEILTTNINAYKVFVDGEALKDRYHDLQDVFRKYPYEEGRSFEFKPYYLGAEPLPFFPRDQHNYDELIENARRVVKETKALGKKRMEFRTPSGKRIPILILRLNSLLEHAPETLEAMKGLKPIEG